MVVKLGLMNSNLGFSAKGLMYDSNAVDGSRYRHHDLHNEALVGSGGRGWNDRLWLQADIQSPEIEVCFSPESGHC